MISQPDAVVNTYKTFYMPDTADQFDFSQYDYVVGAIDTVKGKLELVMQAQATGTPIISCMGAGNRLDASARKLRIFTRPPSARWPRNARGSCEAPGQAPEGGILQRACTDPH